MAEKEKPGITMHIQQPARQIAKYVPEEDELYLFIDDQWIKMESILTAMTELKAGLLAGTKY